MGKKQYKNNFMQFGLIPLGQVCRRYDSHHRDKRTSTYQSVILTLPLSVCLWSWKPPAFPPCWLWTSVSPSCCPLFPPFLIFESKLIFFTFLLSVLFCSSTLPNFILSVSQVSLPSLPDVLSSCCSIIQLVLFLFSPFLLFSQGFMQIRTILKPMTLW